MNNRDFSVIAYANGFTLWHYYDKHHTIDEIAKPDFFAKVYTLVGVGDKIMTVASDGYADLIITKVNHDLVELKVLSKVMWDGEI